MQRYTRRRLLLALGCVMATPALPRDLNGKWADSPYKDWFEKQHNSKHGSCCGNADAELYDGDYHLLPDGSVVLADGTHIEPWKVLLGYNPVHRPVLWRSGSIIYCFAPGTLI